MTALQFVSLLFKLPLPLCSLSARCAMSFRITVTFAVGLRRAHARKNGSRQKNRAEFSASSPGKPVPLRRCPASRARTVTGVRRDTWKAADLREARKAPCNTPFRSRERHHGVRAPAQTQDWLRRGGPSPLGGYDDFIAAADRRGKLVELRRRRGPPAVEPTVSSCANGPVTLSSLTFSPRAARHAGEPAAGLQGSDFREAQGLLSSPW